MKHHIIRDDWSWFERLTGLLIVAAAIAMVLLALSAIVASADGGNCVGYTWAPGVVTATPRGRVTVNVDDNYGTRWTLLRFTVGEHVLVRGFACWGKLDGRFAVRKVR